VGEVWTLCDLVKGKFGYEPLPFLYGILEECKGECCMKKE
jgi:hypothetical protein